MCGRYSLTKFANFLIFVLRAEIVAIFEPKVVDILFLLSRSKVSVYMYLLHSHHIFILRTYIWKEHSKNELI